MTTSVNIYLSCHCRTFTSTVTLPTTSLPLKSATCHCSICRHSSGHLFATFAVIPLSTNPNCSGLSSFDSSKDLTRWFCRTCGCSIWNDDRGRDEWELATGIITGISYGTANPGITYGQSRSRGPGSPEGTSADMSLIDDHLLNRVQLWVSSTRDGGGAIWLDGGRQPDDNNNKPTTTIHRHTLDRNSPTVTDTDLKSMIHSARSNPTSNPTTTIPLTCACGLVKITLTRPTPTTKYPAGIDACWSCRLTTGFEITSWATVPSSHFSWSSDSDSDSPGTTTIIDLGEAEDSGKLIRYDTTKDRVSRYFCGGCGVQVFCDIRGRSTWDVGVGLFGAGEGEEEGEGVRVEGWLRWDKYQGTVQYVEDASDPGFVDGMKKGVERDEEGVWGWISR